MIRDKRNCLKVHLQVIPLDGKDYTKMKCKLQNLKAS